MALESHLGINNYTMVDKAEDKLNEFEISKSPKLLHKVLVEQALKWSKALLKR